jgi:hypothetical protein
MEDSAADGLSPSQQNDATNRNRTPDHGLLFVSAFEVI